MQPDQQNGLPTLNGLSGPGRPTKRTKRVVAELLDAISAGAPFNLACQAAGIAHQTFQDWRRRCPAFALQVDQAAARGTIGRLKEIEAQGKDGAWQALSWLCERRHPAEFAKPEVALNIGIQNNNTTANGGGFESLVVSDLEFLGLRKREGYEHRPHEREAREVEGEITVEPALSGHLNRDDHPNGAVISESQASANAKRVSKVDAKIEQLIKARRAGNGSHTVIPEPPAGAAGGMKLAPIVMPAGEPGPAGGVNSAKATAAVITKEAAVYVCRTRVREVLGGIASQSTTVEFDGDLITLRDLHGRSRI